MSERSGRPRPTRPFLVQLGEWHRLVGTRLEVDLRARADELDDELQVSGSYVPAEAPIAVKAALEIVSGGVVATGVAHTTWKGECRRCLEEATGTLEARFTELCVEEPEDDSTYAVSSFALDLEPIVHDTCILELPLAPLCRPECLGLCPICGVDRNRETCECEPRPDGRWGVLSHLYDEQTRAEVGEGTPES